MEIPGRWLHRTAVLLVCLIWPLIWVGGLVTTYDAGMAVPDWPGTYGYNMFLYPWQTWLYGPFDLLIEHGHRLLAAVVGMVAIVATVCAWMGEPRRWVTWMAAGVLVAVVAQGMLGGFRVIQDDRTLAMVHGCFASACFALATGVSVVTSRWWWMMGPGADGEGQLRTQLGRSTVWLGGCLFVACLAQVVLGAQLRHVQPDTTPGVFRHLVEAHVGTALLVALIGKWVWWRLRRCGELALSRPSRLLLALVAVQWGLGIVTWIVNYGVVVHSERWAWAARYVILSKGYIESLIVTGHVATGQLLVAFSVVIWLRLMRTAETRAVAV